MATTIPEEVEIHVSERQFSLLGLVDRRVKDYEFLLNFQLLSTSENPESVRPTTLLKKIGSDSQTITKIREELIGENTSNEAATASEEVEIHMSEEH